MNRQLAVEVAACVLLLGPEVIGGRLGGSGHRLAAQLWDVAKKTLSLRRCRQKIGPGPVPAGHEGGGETRLNCSCAKVRRL